MRFVEMITRCRLAVALEPDGTVPSAMSPAAFAERVRDDLAQWKQVATEHKIVAE